MGQLDEHAHLAEQLIDVLLQAGVERVYSVGDSLNPVVDASRRADGIECVAAASRELGPRRARRLWLLTQTRSELTVRPYFR